MNSSAAAPKPANANVDGSGTVPIENAPRPVNRKSEGNACGFVGGVYWKTDEAPKIPCLAAGDSGSVVTLLSQTRTTRFAVVPLGMVSKVSTERNHDPMVCEVDALKVDTALAAALTYPTKLGSKSVEA